jgi:hypothetical protein
MADLPDHGLELEEFYIEWMFLQYRVQTGEIYERRYVCTVGREGLGLDVADRAD